MINADEYVDTIGRRYLSLSCLTPALVGVVWEYIDTFSVLK